MRLGLGLGISVAGPVLHLGEQAGPVLPVPRGNRILAGRQNPRSIRRFEGIVKAVYGSHALEPKRILELQTQYASRKGRTPARIDGMSRLGPP